MRNLYQKMLFEIKIHTFLFVKWEFATGQKHYRHSHSEVRTSTIKIANKTLAFKVKNVLVEVEKFNFIKKLYK